MKKIVYSSLSAIFIICLMMAGPGSGTEINVSITNITHGSYFTPLLITAHDSSTHLFELGKSASTSLQAMAEGGSITELSNAIGGMDDDTVENPAGGLLSPGSTTTADLNTMTTGNTHLSLVAMILPSNDGFVGVDSIMIPSATGTYVFMINAYDAGTEANNELATEDGGVPGTMGFPNPPPVGSTDTGGSGITMTENNTTVHIHRGILGDRSPTGGMSDIDSSVYRWLNPVARLVLTIK